MSEQYAFAVSAVRAMETELITPQQLKRLISAKDESDLLDMLESMGLDLRPDPEAALKKYKADTFDSLRALAPDCEELKIFIALNDMHNIKAALKCMAAGERDARRFYLYPTELDLSSLLGTLESRSFYELKKPYDFVAETGCEIISGSLDGQLLEAFIDKETLKLMKKTAEQSGSELVKKYIDFFVKLCDAKTAFRFSKTKKNKEFVLSALCGSDGLDAEALASFAKKGTDELIAFLSNSEISEGALLLKDNPSEFEKWGNDRLCEIVGGAKLESFGPDPIFAYYTAVTVQVKAIKMLLVCKKIGLSAEQTKERLGELYV